MEKKLNVRKEVFESLRLELQEFTPQEFVAGCYKVTIPCSALNYVSSKTGNKTGESHNCGGHSEVLKFPNKNDPPTHVEIISRLAPFVEPGYTSTRNNFNNNYTTGFLFGSDKHFSQWSIVDTNIEPIATTEHPNASG